MGELRRIIVPAAVAAGAWVASSALSALAGTYGGFTLPALARLVAPRTLPSGAETWPGAWGALAALLSALALGAAFALLATPLRRRSGGDLIVRIAAVWFAAVLAGVVMALAEAAGTLLAAGSGAPLSLALGTASTAVAAAGHWGVAWGWLPALVAVSLDRRAHTAESGGERPSPAARGRRASVALLGLAVFGALSLGGLGAASAGGQAALNAQYAAEVPPEPTEPMTEPVPDVAPGEWTVDPLWCTDGQLEYSVGAGDAGLGSRILPMFVTNVSDAPCALESYPDVAFSTAVGVPVEVSVDHGGGMMADDAGVQRVELLPGGQATAALTWRGQPASDEYAEFLRIAAYHGGVRGYVELEPNDITGGAVSVTAWGPWSEPGPPPAG